VWVQNPDNAQIVTMLPMYLTGIPMMILCLKRIPAQVPEKKAIGAVDLVKAALMSLGIAYLTNLAGVLVTFLIGLVKGEEVENVVESITASPSLLALLLLFGILAPIVEEYVFRKLLMDRLTVYGEGVAIFASAVLFGLFHMNLNQFAYTFCLGAFFAFLYVKTGRLWVVAVLHMIVNIFGSVISTWVTRAGETATMAFGMAVMLILFAGPLLLLTAFLKKRLTLSEPALEYSKSKKAALIFGNIGMGIFTLLCVAMIVFQLFM
jgi:membrane protease YdiL (CAAX protease family)